MPTATVLPLKTELKRGWDFGGGERGENLPLPPYNSERNPALPIILLPEIVFKPAHPPLPLFEGIDWGDWTAAHEKAFNPNLTLTLRRSYK